MKTFYWLVKREFWEYKGAFVWAPLVTGLIFLAINVMALVTGEVFGNRNHWTRFTLGNAHFDGIASPEALAQVGAGLDIALYIVACIIIGVTAIAVFFYCLGTLYDDRRDRSILFWKSLPLSDTATVLSKVASGVVVAPAIATIIGVVTGLALMLLAVVAASFHGMNLGAVLMQAHPVRVVINLVLLIPLYALWALPTVGWLMLCSAWARSKPFLWAISLPIGAGVMVSWFNLLGAFNVDSRWYWQNIAGRMLGGLMPGGWVRDMSPLAGMDKQDPASIEAALSLGQHYSALLHPAPWIGAAAGAAMIAGAIWFRRWRDDS